MYSRVLNQASTFHQNTFYHEPTVQQMADEKSSPEPLWKHIMRYIDAIDLLTKSRFGVKYSELIDIVKDEMDKVDSELKTLIAERNAIRSIDAELKALEAERDAISNRLFLKFSVPRMGAAKSNEPSRGDDRKPAAVENHASDPNQVHNNSSGENKTEDENKVSNSKSVPSPSTFDHESEQDTPFHMSVPICTDPEVKKSTSRGCKVNEQLCGATRKFVVRVCKVHECTKRPFRDGLCFSHFWHKAVKTKGGCSALGPEKKNCEVEGCTKQAYTEGMCRRHCHEHKAPRERNKCKLEGCTNQSRMKGMCWRHYNEHNEIETARTGQKRKMRSMTDSQAADSP